MQPDEAPSSASPDAPVIDSAPVADVVLETPSAETQAPQSMAEIGRAIQAANEADAATDDGQAPSPAAPESPPAKPERQAKQRYTVQGALQLVREYRATGRDAEIPPEAMGMVRAFESDAIARHETERQQEISWRDAYVEQLALEATDPASALARIKADAKLAPFMDAYAKAHPEVTLDNPDVMPRQQEDPAQVRQSIDGEYRSAMSEFVEALAEEHEIPIERMQDISKKGLGPFGAMNDLIAVAIERGVEAGIAKELPRRIAEEAKAIRLEAQAQYAGRTIITPRFVPGGVPALNAPGRDPSASLSMREAGQQALREMQEAT